MSEAHLKKISISLVATPWSPFYKIHMWNKIKKLKATHLTFLSQLHTGFSLLPSDLPSPLNILSTSTEARTFNALIFSSLGITNCNIGSDAQTLSHLFWLHSKTTLWRASILPVLAKVHFNIRYFIYRSFWIFNKPFGLGIIATTIKMWNSQTGVRDRRGIQRVSG